MGLRIAFFTPLAPLQTAIADHSEGLLPYLAQGAEIDLFIDEGYKPTSENIVEQFDIYACHEFPRRAADYDLTVYAMGNNLTFHGYMHDFIGSYPGIVLFHDIDFQHYFIARTLARGDVAAYRAEMEYAYGAEGLRAAELVLRDGENLMRGRLPLVERFLDWSRGAIVLNEFARRDLLARRPKARIRQVNSHFYLPRGFQDPVDVDALRQRWGLGDSFVVGTFGLFIPDNRIEICLRAFQRFLDVQPQARYLLAGSHPPIYDVPGMIRSYGLEKSVTLTGWLDSLDFAQHLCVPDVAIHLRYPHIGGMLYTPLRLLGLGRPTILSDIEPLATFPEGCCVKILPDEYEEEILLTILTYLAQHEEFRRRMGENGRRFIHREHNVAQIAQDYLDFFEEVAASPFEPVEKAPAQILTNQIIRESGRILAEWGVSDQDEELLAPIAKAIAELLAVEGE